MSQSKGLGGAGELARQTATTALSGSNSTYVEDIYERYLAGESVPQDWQQYFATLGANRTETAHGPVVRQIAERARSPRSAPVAGAALAADPAGGEKQAAVSRLIQIFTNRGHLIAKLDPLGLTQRDKPRVMQLDYMGLSEADFDTEFFTGTRIEALPRRARLREIVAMLEQVFAGPVGAEFAHVSNTEERLWLQDQFVMGRMKQTFSNEERLNILRQLTAAEGLERYLHTKYVGQKRFSGEGGDTMIPMLDRLIEKAGATGVGEIVMGMAHRGRL
ncbi:MAG TPA: 2-oxoglutarate dehydrogenase E1 component, partial [Steroidobacteraceae bacterium]|nr:2-oxoglutarate dehydrogenase E1 component [Steroidobacteraceae bacterium]